VDRLPALSTRYGPCDRQRRAAPGLWFAFGHAHHGFTLGPVTGRLLAEMMTGEEPVHRSVALRRAQVPELSWGHSADLITQPALSRLPHTVCNIFSGEMAGARIWRQSAPRGNTCNAQ
jgi:hypothetical protein